MLDKFLRPLIPGGKKRKPARSKAKRSNTIPAEATHTFAVQKAYCVPAKGVIMQALEPYEIPVSNYSERVVMSHRAVTDKRLADVDIAPPVPAAQEATFSVPARRANWAEYLLWHTQKLVVVGGKVNPRNEELARRPGAKLPTPWSAGKAPWVEADCKHGQQCLARLHKQRHR